MIEEKAANDVVVNRIREASRRRERDFISLFNALWYRDFPYIRGRTPPAVRAMYTAHINSIVKACADLMGFFTLFEQGRRTDAIIQKADGRVWAKLEFEWRQPFKEGVNEIEKLSDAAIAKEADYYVFIGYSEDARLEENLEAIRRQWKSNESNLLAIIIVFRIVNGRRNLSLLATYVISGDKFRRLRVQHALPWHVPGTRWSVGSETEGRTG